MRLLVVDFDYFFPTVDDGPDFLLYSWDHQEGLPTVVQEFVWLGRAAALLCAGRELPGLSGEQETFWSRFRFTPNARLYYADSNAWAYDERVRRGVDELWLFDAHHDSGYSPDALERILEREAVTCEDWMLLYDTWRTDLHMRYPSWRTRALEIESEPAIELDRQVASSENWPTEPFDRVFVCRSGTWVPPWVDEGFWHFVEAAPLAATKLDDVQPRTFALDQAEAMAAKERILLDKARAGMLES